MPKKILIIPPCPWYMEANVEYLIRYLSDEFIIEVADVPYPPYEDMMTRFPEVQPFQRNPDDYDLLWPLLPSHWVVTEKDKYAHKIASVFYQPNEGRYEDIAVVGCTTPIAHAGFNGKPHHCLRFGVDANLFQPIKMVREDDKLRVGMIGTLVNPRRMVKEVIKPLFGLDGVKVMLFTTNPINPHDVETMGGEGILEHIVGGHKTWPGLPNLYNQLDVLIRCDSDPGYAFPVVEAAACGVPCIATDQGIEAQFCNAGGGLLVKAEEYDSNGSGRAWYLDHPDQVASEVYRLVKYCRDNRDKTFNMGLAARREVEKNWIWEKCITDWRQFFREGVDHANRDS